MRFGLADKQIEQISAVLGDSGVSKAVVFGSRAKGNHRNNSDVDIAVWGSGLHLGKLSTVLDELSMPYKFDVVSYEKINNFALSEHIDRVGQVIYSKHNTTLDRLIANHCPNGVDYVALSEVTEYSKSRIKASDLDSDNYVGVDNLLPEKQGKVASEYVPENGMFIKYVSGDVLIGNIRPYLKKIWLADRIGGTNGDVLAVHITDARMTPRFLFYLLSSDDFFVYNVQHSKGAKMPRGNKNAIMQFKIPLPPREIQDEIVRILDQFTELTAELTARRKQYSYYRDGLLDFESDLYDTSKGQMRGNVALVKLVEKLCPNGVDIKTLEDIATNMFRGSGIKRDEVTDDGEPCVRYGEIYTDYGIHFDECISKTKSGAKKFGHGAVLFAITGEKVEVIGKSTVYTGHKTCYAGGDIVVMEHEQNPKYLGYALATDNAQRQKSKGKIKSKVVHTNIPSLQKISIPLPPCEIQDEIVRILDQFSELVDDISKGLPAEIAARQRQYEYYRDKLLRFEERIA
jgi:type I restriction enzyme S subunit